MQRGLNRIREPHSNPAHTGRRAVREIYGYADPGIALVQPAVYGMQWAERAIVSTQREWQHTRKSQRSSRSELSGNPRKRGAQENMKKKSTTIRKKRRVEATKATRKQGGDRGG